MGSHSVTCHPTQVNAPHLTPAMHAGWYSIYLPRRDERLNWPSWFDRAPAGNRTSDLSITSPTPNRCTTKTTDQDLVRALILSFMIVCPRINHPDHIGATCNNMTRCQRPTKSRLSTGMGEVSGTPFLADWRVRGTVISSPNKLGPMQSRKHLFVIFLAAKTD